MGSSSSLDKLPGVEELLNCTVVLGVGVWMIVEECKEGVAWITAGNVCCLHFNSCLFVTTNSGKYLQDLCCQAQSCSSSAGLRLAFFQKYSAI